MATITVPVGPDPNANLNGIPDGTAATTTLQLQNLSTGAGLILLVTLANYVSGTVTVVVSGVSSNGHTWPILTSTALGAAGTTELQIAKGIPAAINLAANALMPPNIQVVATVSGGASLTFGIDVVVTN